MQYYSEFFPSREENGVKGTTTPIITNEDLIALQDVIDHIADDSVITPDEKIRGLIPLNQDLEARYNSTLDKATLLSLEETTRVLAMISAYEDWIEFRDSLEEPSLWSDTSGYTDVDREAFTEILNAYITSIAEADAYNIPTTADQIQYIDPVTGEETGETVNDLKPAEPNATEGAPAGTVIDDVPAEDVANEIKPNILTASEKQHDFVNKVQGLWDRYTVLVSLINNSTLLAAVQDEYDVATDYRDDTYTPFVTPLIADLNVASAIDRTEWNLISSEFTALLDSLDAAIKTGAPAGTTIVDIPAEDIANEVRPGILTASEKSHEFSSKVQDLWDRYSVLLARVQVEGLYSITQIANALDAATESRDNEYTPFVTPLLLDLNNASTINRDAWNVIYFTFAAKLEALQSAINLYGVSHSDIIATPVDTAGLDYSTLAGIGAAQSDMIRIGNLGILYAAVKISVKAEFQRLATDIATLVAYTNSRIGTTSEASNLQSYYGFLGTYLDTINAFDDMEANTIINAADWVTAWSPIYTNLKDLYDIAGRPIDSIPEIVEEYNPSKLTANEKVTEFKPNGDALITRFNQLSGRITTLAVSFIPEISAALEVATSYKTLAFLPFYNPLIADLTETSTVNRAAWVEHVKDFTATLDALESAINSFGVNYINIVDQPITLIDQDYSKSGGVAEAKRQLALAGEDTKIAKNVKASLYAERNRLNDEILNLTTYSGKLSATFDYPAIIQPATNTLVATLTALLSYLGGLTGFYDVNVVTTVVPATWNAKWNAVYDAVYDLYTKVGSPSSGNVETLIADGKFEPSEKRLAETLIFTIGTRFTALINAVAPYNISTTTLAVKFNALTAWVAELDPPLSDYTSTTYVTAGEYDALIKAFEDEFKVIVSALDNARKGTVETSTAAWLSTVPAKQLGNSTTGANVIYTSTKFGGGFHSQCVFEPTGKAYYGLSTIDANRESDAASSVQYGFHFIPVTGGYKLKYKVEGTETFWNNEEIFTKPTTVRVDYFEEGQQGRIQFQVPSSTNSIFVPANSLSTSAGLEFYAKAIVSAAGKVTSLRYAPTRAVPFTALQGPKPAVNATSGGNIIDPNEKRTFGAVGPDADGYYLFDAADRLYLSPGDGTSYNTYNGEQYFGVTVEYKEDQAVGDEAYVTFEFLTSSSGTILRGVPIRSKSGTIAVPFGTSKWRVFVATDFTSGNMKIRLPVVTPRQESEVNNADLQKIITNDGIEGVLAGSAIKVSSGVAEYPYQLIDVDAGMNSFTPATSRMIWSGTSREGYETDSYSLYYGAKFVEIYPPSTPGEQYVNGWTNWYPREDTPEVYDYTSAYEPTRNPPYPQNTFPYLPSPIPSQGMAPGSLSGKVTFRMLSRPKGGGMPVTLFEHVIFDSTLGGVQPQPNPAKTIVEIPEDHDAFFVEAYGTIAKTGSVDGFLGIYPPSLMLRKVRATDNKAAIEYNAPVSDVIYINSPPQYYLDYRNPIDPSIVPHEAKEMKQPSFIGLTNDSTVPVVEVTTSIYRPSDPLYTSVKQVVTFNGVTYERSCTPVMGQSLTSWPNWFYDPTIVGYNYSVYGWVKQLSQATKVRTKDLTNTAQTTTLGDGDVITIQGTAANITNQAVTATNSDFSVVTGETKPSDNAGTSGNWKKLGVGVKISGNTIGKSAPGTHGAWDGGAVGTPQTSGIYISGSITSPVAGGGWLTTYALDTNATSFVSDNGMKYAVTINTEGAGNGTIYLWSNGVVTSCPFTGATVESRVKLAYDNANVIVSIDGKNLLSVAAETNLKLWPKVLNHFLDKQFGPENGPPHDIQSAPYTNNATAGVGLYSASDSVYAIAGNVIEKIHGDGSWSATVYSRETYVGSCIASAILTDFTTFVGLTDTKASPISESYTELDYSFYRNNVGNVDIYESGGYLASFSGVPLNEVLSIIYDGVNVKYYTGATLRRTVTTTANRSFSLASCIYGVDQKVTGLSISPYTDNAFTSLGGLGAVRGQIITLEGTAANISNQGTGATANNLTQLNSTEGNKLTSVATGAGTSGTWKAIGTTPSALTIVGNSVSKTGGTHGNWGDAAAVGTPQTGPCFITTSIISPTIGGGWQSGVALDTSETRVTVDPAGYRYSVFILTHYSSVPDTIWLGIDEEVFQFNLIDPLTVNSRFGIVYDGEQVHAVVDGKPVISKPALARVARMYPKILTCHNEAGQENSPIHDIQSGPYNDVSWTSMKGVGLPANNATADLVFNQLRGAAIRPMVIQGNSITQGSAVPGYDSAWLNYAAVNTSYKSIRMRGRFPTVTGTFGVSYTYDSPFAESQSQEDAIAYGWHRSANGSYYWRAPGTGFQSFGTNLNGVTFGPTTDFDLIVDGHTAKWLADGVTMLERPTADINHSLYPAIIFHQAVGSIDNLRVESWGTVGAQVGVNGNLRLESGSTTTDAAIVTSVGTAANFLNQGTLATKNQVVPSLMANQSSDNVIPDGSMRDPAWWAQGGGSNGFFTQAAAGSYWSLSENQLGMLPGNRDCYSSFFDVQPGSTYKIEVRMYSESSFVGFVNPVIHVPAQSWYGLASGTAIEPTDPAYAYFNGGEKYKQATYIVKNPDASGEAPWKKWQFRICGNFTGGNFYFQFRITRVTTLGDTIVRGDGNTPVTDNTAITALGTAANIANQAPTATNSNFSAITGATKPAAYATADLVMTQRKGQSVEVIPIEGNLVKSLNGASWYFFAASTRSLSGPCRMTARMTGGTSMFGLTIHPNGWNVEGDYAQYAAVQYAFYRAGASRQIYENGGFVKDLGSAYAGVTFDDNTVFEIIDNGFKVIYRANGVEMHVSTQTYVSYQERWAAATPIGGTISEISFTTYSDVTALNQVSMPFVAPITLNATPSGTLETGQLPIYQQMSYYLGNLDVSQQASWTISTTGLTATVNNDPTSFYRGMITITDVTEIQSQVSITAVYNGIPQTRVIKIIKNLRLSNSNDYQIYVAYVNNIGGNFGNYNDSYVYNYADYSNTGSHLFNVGTDGNLQFTGAIPLSSAGGPGFSATQKLRGKIQYSTTGVYTDFSDLIAEQGVDFIDTDNSTNTPQPFTWTLNYNINGLTPNQSIYLRFAYRIIPATSGYERVLEVINIPIISAIRLKV
jgi:hypothetical protein